ncbi:MAG: hypothetical protein HC779_05620 [Phyllobacteriaceae bacterium]|nr:hypothetical protein [Phyllobacteriaceae bacterium]
MGDAALAQDDDTAFLLGLGAFLLAHIAYAVLFFGLGGPVQATDWPGFTAVGLFALGVGTLMVRRAGPLALPVAAYVLAIAAMGMGAVMFGGWVLAGAALFMASDALLGLDRFVLPPASPLKPVLQAAVWVLYWLGQAMIAISLVRLALLGG